MIECVARFLPGRPADAHVRILALGEHRLQMGEGVVIRFDCDESWVADFEMGIGSLTALELLGSSSFVVISRGATYVVDARSQQCERLRGITTAYQRAQRDGLICATQTDVFLCTATGMAWRTTVSSDGVTLSHLTAEGVKCTGWDAASDTAYEFLLSWKDGCVLARVPMKT
jgi:hypothetical protein